MPLFTYKASNQEGVIVDETIQASNKDDAVLAVKNKGFQVLTINPLGGKVNRFSSGGISVSEKANFARFLATMIRSGMSLPEGLEMLREETTNKRMKKILANVSYQIQKGQSLSASLSQYEKDFDPIFLTMVRVGEESGTLDISLDYLSKQLTTTYELTQKIKGSLMYPAVIVIAMIGNGLLMTTFVLPRISGVFLKLDLPLPAYTKITLQLGEFFGNNIPLVYGTTFALFIAAIASIRFRKSRDVLVKLFTKLPASRKLLIQIDIARFSRTLATLLKNGVPIVESLEVAAESMSHPKIKIIAKGFGEKVSRGESLSTVILEAKKYFPSIVMQSIKAGEKSGKLDEVLDEMADFYEKEVEFSLKRLTSLIEPVLMLVVGVVVGIMVIMMISPIYSIIGGLQSTIQP